MTKNTITPVFAKNIRVAFREGERGLDATKVVDAKGNAVNPASVLGADGDATRCRGRLNPAFVSAYLAAFPEHDYAEKSVSPSAQVELPITKTSKSGATLKRPEVFAASDVRKMLGHEPGKRGRLSQADLAKAAQMVMDSRKS